MNPQEAIIAAVKAKDAAQVEALLQADPTLIQTASLVLTAAYNGAHEVTKVLLRHNPPLDVFAAAAAGAAERLAQLLDQEPGLRHAANADGFEPLHLAAFFGHATAAQVLLDRGVDLNRIMSSKVPYVPANTALHAAAAGGPHGDVVRLLVAAGADVNQLDSNGHTPLHSAAFNGDLEMVAYLLQHGADVNRHGEGAPTALAYLLQHEKTAAAAALRAAGGVA